MEAQIYPMKFIKTEFSNNKFFYGLLTVLFSGICYFASRAVEARLPHENSQNIQLHSKQSKMTGITMGINPYDVLGELQLQNLSLNQTKILEKYNPEADFAAFLQRLNPDEKAPLMRLEKIIDNYKLNRNYAFTIVQIKKIELTVKQDQSIKPKSKAFVLAALAFSRSNFKYWNEYFWLDLTESEQQTIIFDYWKSDLNRFEQKWDSSKHQKNGIFKQLESSN